MPDPRIHIAASGLTVGCPNWENSPPLIHGTTTRQALPEHGKADLFEALARARAAGALPTMWTVGAEQVHGATVQVIDRPLEPRHHPKKGYRHDDALQAGEFPETDALATTIPGVLLLIQTADCLPVFLLDRTRRVCGLAHGGWRGLYSGIVGKLARTMLDIGAEADELEAWLGPAIGVANYEVSDELVQKFREAFPGVALSPDGRHLDLVAIARHELQAAGVAADRIAVSGECTLAREDRYHSYRAAGERAGRMLSFIGFRADAMPDDT